MARPLRSAALRLRPDDLRDRVAAIRARRLPRSRYRATRRRLLILSRVTLAVGVLIPLIGLLPELLYLSPDLNDGAFHLGITLNTIAAVREGANPLDFWVPTWLTGFPLFHYYQPGPYLLLAALYELLLQSVPLFVLFRLLHTLALALFPATNYLALRWLRLPRETAGWGALLSCLIAAHGAYGIEFESFVRTGWGLWAQALALPLLPLALAGGWRAVRGRGRSLRFALILAAAFLTHILYGYIAAVSLGLAPFMLRRPRRLATGVGRLIRLYAQTFALIAFFVVPLAMDLAYHAKSLFDPAAKFDSYGAGVILTRLVSGSLLDYQRVPVLTCLAAVGLYFCARKWLQRGSPVHGWIGGGFILWTLLYFGRPTWGALMDLLPLSHGLHLERLSSGVHIFAIWLAAIALGRLSRWCLGLESPDVRFATTVGCLLLLVPAIQERVVYLAGNARISAESQQVFDRQASQFEPVRRALHAADGRVYPGHSGNWGRNYKVGYVPLYYWLTGEAITQIGNAPYSWALPTDSQFQLQWPSPADYNLWDMRYLLTDQSTPPPPGATLLVRSGPHHLYRLPSEGPFALVSVPLAVAGNKDSTVYAVQTWLKSAWPGAHAYARLLFGAEAAGTTPVVRMQDAVHYVAEGAASARSVFATPDLFTAAPPAPPAGVLADVAQSRQEASATVSVPAPTVVLFKSTYHPGWQAFVDGVRAPTMLLSPGFVGVEVPAGFHSLQVVYRSGWWKAMLLVCGVAVAIVIDRVWPV